MGKSKSHPSRKRRGKGGAGRDLRANSTIFVTVDQFLVVVETLRFDEVVWKGVDGENVEVLHPNHPERLFR